MCDEEKGGEKEMKVERSDEPIVLGDDLSFFQSPPGEAIGTLGPPGEAIGTLGRAGRSSKAGFT